MMGAPKEILEFLHYHPLSFRTVDSVDYKKAMLIFTSRTTYTPLSKYLLTSSASP